jgi:tetratricopeptide (TPR) repeat protein
MRLILILFLFAPAVLLDAQLQAPQELFQRGNEFYRAAKFKEAAAAYDTILQQGTVSAELYFNLGNVYFRLGNFARAILYYERAARLNPNDADIQHNLRLVSLRSVDRIEPVPELFLTQWIQAATSVASPATGAGMFAGVWVLFFFSLSVMVVTRAPGVMKFSRRIFFVSIPLMIAAGLFFAAQQVQEAKHNAAIVISTVVTAKSSPDEQSVDAFVIHEGLKVNVSDAVGEWLKITLPDGKVGWIKSAQCEKI